MKEGRFKRYSSPVVKSMTTGITSPTPTAEILRCKSFDTPGIRTSLSATMNQNSTIDNITDTPLQTPHRKASSVNLSPSRTLSESLTSLATSTAQQLEEIWDVIGYSPQDRSSELSDLLVKMQALCEEKIAEENAVVVTYRHTIEEVKEEMRVTCAALKKLPDEKLLQPSDGGAMQLVDELQALESAMKGIREAANAAKKDLMECRDYLVEAHEALELDMDEKWRDAESDLTPFRREEFHLKKEEMKDELSTRSSAVIQLVRDCQQLMADLRIDAKNGSDLEKRIAGSLVRSKDGSSMMKSKFRTDSCMGLSSTALDELTKKVAELHVEKRRRKAILQDMGAEIALLWEKLRIPEQEQRAFTESVQGLGMSTIEKGEVELKRLLAIKSAMLDKLILESRSTILSLWEQIDTPKEQRDAFEAFKVSESHFNDKLLDLHDKYAATLQTQLEEMKPILRIIERRQEILRERMEYEELQKDSERLQQRGASMTHQLMKEEKMARRIKKELPKLTETLLGQLADWKEKHGEDFQHGGRVYLDIMDDQEDEWQEYKANEHQRKQMKKQEELALTVENRFAIAPFKKSVTRPLGDARLKENSRGIARTKSGLAKPQRDVGTQRSETMT